MTKDQTRKPRVVVFSTPTCPHCRTAKRFLESRGVSYTDVDVSRDARAARDMVRISGQQGVPVIQVDGKVVVGFNRPKLERLLGLRS